MPEKAATIREDLPEYFYFYFVFRWKRFQHFVV
jgi:hypothetical protein